MDFPALFKCRLLLIFSQLCGVLAETVEVCNLEQFNAGCPPGHVIMMMSAKYGLMRKGKCVPGDITQLGCSADVLALSDMKCSGRNKCDVSIPDSDFESKAPHRCSMMKLYYEATYDCVKVQYIRNRNCQRCDYIKVGDNTGLLSSSVTQDTRCGSEHCPWLIEAPPGQKLQLSLYDFGTYNYRRSGSGSHCNVYMVIKDGESGIPFTVCGDRLREKKRFYTSKSNRVYVRVHVPDDTSAAQPDMDQFLLKYEVTGCELLLKPDYGWVRYDSVTAYIGCNATGTESTLTCKNNTWEGRRVNCSNPVLDQNEDGSTSSLTNVLVVAIIAGVAVCMCSCVVVIGLCCFKGMSNKRRHQRLPPPPPYDVTYDKHAGDIPESHVMLAHKDDPDIQKSCDVHGLIRHVDHVKTKQGYRKQEGKEGLQTLNRGHHTLKPAKPHYEQIWEKQHAKTAHMKNTL